MREYGEIRLRLSKPLWGFRLLFIFWEGSPYLLMTGGVMSWFRARAGIDPMVTRPVLRIWGLHLRVVDYEPCGDVFTVRAKHAWWKMIIPFVIVRGVEVVK